MGQTVDRLLLLLWKNWVLQKRRRRKLLIDVSIPLFIGAFLLYVRYSVKTYDRSDPTTFNPFRATYIPSEFPLSRGNNTEDRTLDVLFSSLDDELGTKAANTIKQNSAKGNIYGYIQNLLHKIKFKHRWKLVWSPDHEALNEVMMLACKKMNVDGMQVKNSETLEKQMTVPSDLYPEPTKEILAGVVFPDDMVNNTVIPLDLKVKIRFPGESRYGSKSLSGLVPRNWLTSLIFPLIQMPGPRELDDTGGAPGYSREGFLGIQDAILSSLLQHNLRDETNLSNFDIQLQNYPYGKYVLDPLLIVMENMLPFLIVLSFLFSVNTIVEKITTEKETKMKVIMNVMGLSNSLRWTSWFIYSFAFLFVLISILIISFKVPFINGRPVFPHSDWSCLLLFLMCFAFAAVTFCFLVSTIFSKASVASIVSGMVWFLMFVPFYVVQQKYAELSTLAKCASSLFLNTGMGIGFHMILMYEGIGAGIQWSNLAYPATPDDGMSLILVLAIIIFDGLIHLCLALYIENVFPGEHGTPLPWYYPFQRSYWFNDGKKNPGLADDKFGNDEVDYPLENEPKNLAAGIQIKKLRKIYDKAEKAAVKNLSLNAYEGEITVLLGFNGAGKTTTLSILTGILPPSSGTATIAGYDIRSNMKDVRRNMGYCPQYNILFDDLNVEEHVKFFGRLKGLDKSDIKRETDKYMNLLNLNDKRQTLAKHLSGGMKRKLSVSLAICGDTKVLLFDEPTAGMDPTARRFLWDLLISEKRGRSILITTHHLDEADVLGDRVAIMSEGKLNCYGSPFFLKKRFSCGYRLIIVKEDNYNKQKVDEVIHNYIPTVLSSHEIGMELFYRLPEEYSYKFQQLFQDIEAKKEELQIISFGVSPTSLEDVFMRIAAEVNDHDKEIKGIEQTVSPEKETNVFHEEVKVKILDDHKVTGYQLLLNHTSAMLYKHAKLILQSWKSYLILLLITVGGLGNAVFTIRINNQLLNLPPRVMDLQDFPNGIVAVQATDDCTGFCNEYLNNYKSIMKTKKMKIVNVNSSNTMDEYLIGECEKNVVVYRTKHILGTRFHGNAGKAEITSWFNGIPYHTPAAALSAVYNSLFRAHLEIAASTTFINEPLPYREETTMNIQSSGLGNGFQIAIFVAFSYVFVGSSFVTFPIQERETKAKLLQFVSGINNITFWLVAYVWDIIKSVGPNVTTLITLAAFQEEGFKEPEEIGYCAVVLFSFFISALPLTYLGSLVFKKSALGFVQTTFFHIITGIYSVILVVILQMPVLDLRDVSDGLDWAFSIFPLYSMTRSFQTVNLMSTRLKMCKPIYENFCLKSDNIIHPCCKEPKKCPNSICLPWTESIWDWEAPGFGRYITFLIGTGIIYFMILLVIEYGTFNFSRFERNTPAVDSQTFGTDSDVIAEREKVKTLPEKSRRNYNLLIDGMMKKFKKYVAVKDLYLSVTEGECFGLLGANGAGKTTTFRMLTGDEYPSSGNAYIQGLSIRSEMKRIHQKIGYCPQFDALFEDLTGREHLRLYGLIRGIPSGDIDEISAKFARELLFEQHLDKKVKEYSGGNKRKLSTALALIGNPPIVYLDEPTAGVDPVAKRHLWAVISKLRAQGTTIILTSHSMEECEALCTRLSIMVKGEFKCLGTTQYLKNKYCQGYSLAIKIKRQNQSSLNDVNNGSVQSSEIGEDNTLKDSRIVNVKNFVVENFRGAVPLEEHEDVLVYRIPSTDLSWSKMFGVIESVKDELHIEDYSLGQTTLEQIILMFIGTSDTET